MGSHQRGFAASKNFACRDDSWRVASVVRRPGLDDARAWRLSAFGSATVNSKNNLSEKFDTRTYDVNAGLQYKYDQSSYTIAFQNNHFYLDGDAFRRAYGATLQWLHNIDDRNQAGLFMQYSRLNYVDSSFRNADIEPDLGRFQMLWRAALAVDKKLLKLKTLTVRSSVYERDGSPARPLRALGSLPPAYAGAA